MSRRKANIRPDLIGKLFIDGNDIVYRLTRCDAEPLAAFELVGKEDRPELLKSISEFANLVQLKPVRPVEKPKKPRAGLGGTHKKPKSKALSGFTISQTTLNKEPVFENIKKKAAEEIKEIADKKGDNLIIHVPTEAGGFYRITVAGWQVVGLGLRETVLLALEKFGGKIPDELTEQQRATIQGILDAGE